MHLRNEPHSQDLFTVNDSKLKENRKSFIKVAFLEQRSPVMFRFVFELFLTNRPLIDNCYYRR